MLDTNAWLDLLVFDDPAVRGLAACIERGDLTVAIDVRAIDELARVLRYPVLQLDDVAVDTCLANARRLSVRVDVPALGLPRCRDPDDQMFLEIAVSAGAVALLTRDDALLRMSRRMAREHGLAIVPPATWRDVLPDQISKR